MDLSYAGDKGSNIVLQDKHSQIILNSNKKGGENIIIKDNKHNCCGHKEHVKYVYVPVYTHHEHQGWGQEHQGWGHEQQHWGGWQ